MSAPVPATTGMRVAKPFIEILDMTPSKISDHFTGALVGIGAFGAVCANWSRADGWRGLVRNATIGAGFGYGMARLLRDGVDKFRPLPIHEAQRQTLIDATNACVKAERLLGIQYDPKYTLPTLQQRLDRVTDAITGRNHELGTLRDVNQEVIATINASGGNGNVFFANAEAEVEKQRQAHIAAKAAERAGAASGTPPRPQQLPPHLTAEQQQVFLHLKPEHQQYVQRLPLQQQKLLLQGMITGSGDRESKHASEKGRKTIPSETKRDGYASESESPEETSQNRRSVNWTSRGERAAGFEPLRRTRRRSEHTGR
jgi:hypothetical protein